MKHFNTIVKVYLTIAMLVGLLSNLTAGPNRIPVADDFSLYSPGTPLINGTNGWYADSISVVVQSGITGAVAVNSNAAVLPMDTMLSNRFQNVTATNIWTHLYIKVKKYDGTNPPVINTNATVMFYVNSNGYFVMANGTNWEVSHNVQITNEDDWVKLDIFQDYDNKIWWLYVNEIPITNNGEIYNPPPKMQIFGNQVWTNRFINTVSIPKYTGFNIYNGGGATSYLSEANVADVDRLPYVYCYPTNIFQNVIPGVEHCFILKTN